MSTNTPEDARREAERLGDLRAGDVVPAGSIPRIVPTAGGRGPDSARSRIQLTRWRPDCLSSKRGFKQRRRRYKVVAGAEDARCKVILDWAEMRDTNAPTIVPESSGVVDVPRLAQHVFASLFLRTETGTEAPSIVDRTPGENGLEAWRRPVQRLGPAPAQANFSLMSRVLKPSKGRVDNNSSSLKIRRKPTGRAHRSTGTD